MGFQRGGLQMGGCYGGSGEREDARDLGSGQTEAACPGWSLRSLKLITLGGSNQGLLMGRWMD